MTPARRADAGAMTATLAAAFVDDPALAWIMPDDASRPARLALFFRPMVRGAIANGLALRSADAQAVTLWRLPGRINPGFFETLFAIPAMRKALGADASRAALVGRTLKAQAPRFPYWYLQFAGVAPGQQGKGLGGTAIRAGLERARAAGLPVYLETVKPTNVGLYQRLGFRVVDEWDIPEGGPHFWGMLRD